MSEYTAVEQPFLAQLADLGWTVIDQGTLLRQDAAPSLRSSGSRSWCLPGTWPIRMGLSRRLSDCATGNFSSHPPVHGSTSDVPASLAAFRAPPKVASHS